MRFGVTANRMLKFQIRDTCMKDLTSFLYLQIRIASEANSCKYHLLLFTVYCESIFVKKKCL